MPATGKKWKVHTDSLQALIDNADTNGDCSIEVWNDFGDDIANCELWLLLATGWSDDLPEDPPAVNPT